MDCADNNDGWSDSAAEAVVVVLLSLFLGYAALIRDRMIVRNDCLFRRRSWVASSATLADDSSMLL